MSKSKQSIVSECQRNSKMLKSIRDSVDYVPLLSSPKGDGPEVPITSAVYTFIWLYCRPDLTAEEEYEIASVFDAAAYGSSSQERMLKLMDRKIHERVRSVLHGSTKMPR